MGLVVAPYYFGIKKITWLIYYILQIKILIQNGLVQFKIIDIDVMEM